jgi:hypothetical protein
MNSLINDSFEKSGNRNAKSLVRSFVNRHEGDAAVSAAISSDWVHPQSLLRP